MFLDFCRIFSSFLVFVSYVLVFFSHFLVFGCAGLYFSWAGAISGCTGAGFGRTGHMIERSAVPLSSEMREAGIHPEQRRGEKLAYIPSSAEERERERESWHTTRPSPRREMQQPPKLSHAPACRGGLGEAHWIRSPPRGGAPACETSSRTPQI